MSLVTGGRTWFQCAIIICLQPSPAPPLISKLTSALTREIAHIISLFIAIIGTQISLLEECGMLDRALQEMHKMESKIVSCIFSCSKGKN